MKKNRMFAVAAMIVAITCAVAATVTLSAQQTETPAEPAAVVQTVTAAPSEVAAPAEVAAPVEVAAPAEVAAPEKKNPFQATFWALLPPLLAIVLALITKEVFSSLFFGIVLGGCFAANFAPLKVVDLIITNGLIEAIKTTSGIFLFLVLLGAIVGIVNRSGASAAFGKWAQEHVKSRVGAMFTTFLLGVMIFIDDYFNCLTVGSVMSPVTDAKRVSRAKLAYIIDATAAPICMIAPISSWAAAVSQYVKSDEYSGLELFVKAIPYNFYSLLTLIFMVTIILLKVDFGPMAKHEKNAMENGDLFSGKMQTGQDQGPAVVEKARVFDMFIPLVFLIGFCVFALLYVGGILDGKDFVAAFGDTDATVGLPWGALVAMLLMIAYFGARRTVPFKKALECLPQGFIAMVPAIMILTFATGLKNMTELLHAKDFIAAAIGDTAPGLTRLLPTVIFLIACGLSFSTGTAWGTFGLLIPITIAVFPSTDPLFFVGISACLAGAVCGDHCSPISDTTIMSAAGAQCDLITHISTQLPYVIPVTVFSCLGFLLAGFVQNWFFVFPFITVLMIAFLCVVKFLQKRQTA